MHASCVVVVAMVSSRAEGERTRISEPTTDRSTDRSTDHSFIVQVHYHLLKNIAHFFPVIAAKNVISAPQGELKFQLPPVLKTPPPLKQPFWFHQDVDVLDATAVGVVQPFGQVLLQVRFDLLLRFLTLKHQAESAPPTGWTPPPQEHTAPEPCGRSDTYRHVSHQSERVDCGGGEQEVMVLRLTKPRLLLGFTH